MISDLLTVWTPGALLSAIVGGALLGVVVSALDNPRFSAFESAALLLGFGIVAGGVFFAGQIVDTLGSQGPAFAWRVASRFGLFIVFVATMALGMGLAMRHSRGAWRR